MRKCNGEKRDKKKKQSVRYDASFSMSIFFKINNGKINKSFVNATFFIIKNYLIRLIYCLLSTSIQNMNKIIYAGLIFCI